MALHHTRRHRRAGARSAGRVETPPRRDSGEAVSGPAGEAAVGRVDLGGRALVHLARYEQGHLECQPTNRDQPRENFVRRK